MKSKFKVLVWITVLALAVACCYQVSYSNEQTITVDVNKSERVVSGSGKSVKSYYLVFTNKGVYSIEDLIMLGNFRSSDLYGYIQAPGKYTIRTVGYRVPILSMYPVITNAWKCEVDTIRTN